MELNMNDLYVEGNEMEQEMPEATAFEYDRSIYCEDSDRITELVKNLFIPLICKDSNGEDVIYYEHSDQCIKWNTQLLVGNNNNIKALILLEGLLAHRKATGLMTDMYTDETQKPLLTMDTKNELFNNFVVLGNINDEKMLKDISENVLRAANINVDNNEDIIVLKECISAKLPNAEKYVLCMTNLTEEQMSSLKQASHVNKAVRKVSKITSKLNTTTYSLAKNVSEGIVTPLAESGAKLGGLAASTAITASFKAASTGVNEVLHNVNKADLKNYEPYQEAKKNAKELWASLTKRESRNSSYDFNF